MRRERSIREQKLLSTSASATKLSNRVLTRPTEKLIHCTAVIFDKESSLSGGRAIIGLSEAQTGFVGESAIFYGRDCQCTFKG